MTMLVLKDKDASVVTAAWSATGDETTTDVHFLWTFEGRKNEPAMWMAENLAIGFDDFLALIREGGKVVDVRHLQEPK